MSGPWVLCRYVAQMEIHGLGQKPSCLLQQVWAQKIEASPKKKKEKMEQGKGKQKFFFFFFKKEADNISSAIDN